MMIVYARTRNPAQHKLKHRLKCIWNGAIACLLNCADRSRPGRLIGPLRKEVIDVAPRSR